MTPEEQKPIKSPAEGLAVICDPCGRIKKIIRNDVTKSEVKVKPDEPLSGIIDPSNFQKYMDFFLELKSEKATFNWELLTRFFEKPKVFFFAGATLGEELMVVAYQSQSSTEHIFDELLSINNEQTNLIRSTIKEKQKAPLREDQNFYDEFISINNELAALQRESVRKAKALQQSIESKNHFIGILAHDLRGPLSSAKGLCELLLENDLGALNEEQKELISLLQESSSNMMALVTDVLDIAKIESGKLRLNLQKVALTPLIKKNLQFNTLLAQKKSLTLDFKSPSEAVIKTVDPGKINQVLNNLISNAIKFSHPNGTIEVKLKSQDGAWTLEVKDHGVGIPAEALDDIFTPFSSRGKTGTAGEKSTGLGLAICKKIVEGHGGHIEIQSVPQKGTTFRLHFPTQSEGDSGP